MTQLKGWNLLSLPTSHRLTTTKFLRSHWTRFLVKLIRHVARTGRRSTSSRRVITLQSHILSSRGLIRTTRPTDTWHSILSQTHTQLLSTVLEKEYWHSKTVRKLNIPGLMTTFGTCSWAQWVINLPERLNTKTLGMNFTLPSTLAHINWKHRTTFTVTYGRVAKKYVK